MVLKYIFHFLLWNLRIFGLLPSSSSKCVEIISKFFSIFHILYNILMTCYQFVNLEKFYNKFSRDFAIHVGVFLYCVCVATIIINVIEGLVFSKERSVLIDKLIEWNSEPRLHQQIKKLKYKGLFIIPLLLGLLTNWTFGMYHLFGNEVFVFLYINHFILLRTIQFFLTVDPTRIKLDMINEDLKNLVKMHDDYLISDLSVVRKQMEITRKEYLTLKDFSIGVNETESWSLFSLASLFVIHMIIKSYWCLLSLFKDIIMLDAHQNFSYVLLLLLILIITSHACTQCSSLSSEISYNVHKIQLLGEDPATVNQLAMQISNNPINFTAAGYFQINYGLLGSIFAVTVTYLMILISFDKDQGEKFVERFYNKTSLIGIE